MVEVVTSLTKPGDWKPDVDPFYLEVFGETSPLVDEVFAEVVPAGGTGPKQTSDAPVYEYWWTLGHPGAPEEHSHWFKQNAGDKRPWQDLSDPAARIYLYFPLSSGWRANEVTATLKYLSPVPEQHVWLKTAAQDFQAIQPLIGDAASLSGLVPGGATASKWLGAVAKLQMSSLPQNGDLNWSVGKVTFGSQHGLMQGVMWTIPRAVFQRLGGRLTGSLAVSFIPARIQGDVGSADYGCAELIAHAVVYGASGNEWWVPSGEEPGRKFLQLKVSPQHVDAQNIKLAAD